MASLKLNSEGQIAEYPYPFIRFLFDHAVDIPEGELPTIETVDTIDMTQFNVFPVIPNDEGLPDLVTGAHIYQSLPIYQDGQWYETYTLDESKSVKYSQKTEKIISELYPTWTQWERGNKTESEVRDKIAQVAEALKGEL